AEFVGSSTFVPASTLVFELLGSGAPASADVPRSRIPRDKYFDFMQMLQVWLRDPEGRCVRLLSVGDSTPGDPNGTSSGHSDAAPVRDSADSRGKLEGDAPPGSAA